MRVLFCPTHQIYDAENEGSEFAWAFNIADRIASRFPDSVVVTGRTEAGARPYQIVSLTPDEWRFNASVAYAIKFNTRYTLATVRALRRGEFDLVHHVLPFGLDRTYNIAAALLARQTPFVIGPIQMPLAVPDTDLDPTDVRSVSPPNASMDPLLIRAAGPVLRVLCRWTLLRATRLVAVDGAARDELAARGVLTERISIIPPGVDSARFAFVPLEAKPPPPFRLLCVCHLVARKNVALVLHALVEIVRRVPQVELSIVGDGPQRTSLEVLADQLGIRSRVRFEGSVPHGRVREHYGQGHLFVNASRAEGFGTSCLEAMASGLPVVSTPAGGFVEAVRDGENGYIVQQEAAHELADRVTDLLQQPRLLEDFGRRARATAEHSFDWETVIVPRYLDVYAEAVATAERMPSPAID
jgi:glycosyltransferase involved in cell wall biosynthesis